MNIEDEVFARLSNCEHLMQTYIENINYEIDENDDTEDNKNPGFGKGWLHFVDVVSNSIISIPSKEALDDDQEFVIEIIISDEVIAKFNTPEMIEGFLTKCEKKSKYFENVVNLIPENKTGKKLGL